MTIAHTVSAADFENLSDLLKPHYVKEGEDYVVSEDAINAGIETDRTIEPLKKAKEHEQTQRKELERKAREETDLLKSQLADLQSQLESINTDKLTKSGDVEAIKKSYEEKINKVTQEFEGVISKKDEIIKNKFVNSEAKALASELSVDGSHELLYAHIAPRLGLEYSEDGEPKLIIKDKDGNPTVNSLDDLKQEFLADKSYSRVVKGSQASGGGANPKESGGGAPKTDKKLADMTLEERAAYRTQLREQGQV